MMIKIRGISYHYTLHQEDPKLPSLVLLHGFMGSGEAFTSILPDLKKFCNPITIDLLGHGQTEGAEMHYRFSTKEQVADICKLISEQLPTPLYLLGYSMGGRLALQVAKYRPDLFYGLILESTTFGIENEQEQQLRQSLDARRADAIIGDFKNFVTEWSEMPLLKSSSISTETQQHLRSIHLNQNPLWMSNSLLGFGSGTMPCVKDELKELTHPIQLIAGKNDTKFLGIMNAMLKELNHGQLEVIAGAGHRVHLEQSEPYINTIKDFINSTLSHELDYR